MLPTRVNSVGATAGADDKEEHPEEKHIMKTTRKIVTAIAVSGLCAGLAQAADVSAALDLNSAYMWRGLTFNDGLVAQPSIDVAAPHGIGINVWGNFDIDD